MSSRSSNEPEPEKTEEVVLLPFQKYSYETMQLLLKGLCDRMPSSN